MYIPGNQYELLGSLGASSPVSPSVLSTVSYAPLQYGQHFCPKIICSQYSTADVCSFNHSKHLITKGG